ncbi:MAG: hypothetical protein ACOC44_11250 [Promethearchaeia archaeon]
MIGLWDKKADAVVDGDNLRTIDHLRNRSYVDSEGLTHYLFTKKMFDNPRYKIPKDNLKLFEKFLDGGSRSYPSDGNIPLDIVSTEAQLIIHKIIDIASHPSHQYYEDAQAVLKDGKFGMVRGCVKLYLKKYTTRDWRRKRFTDDIDFWIYKLKLYEHVLRETGWTRNKETKEWEKSQKWVDYNTKKMQTGKLIASNNLNQQMDFGNGSYLEGATLKNIFQKKLSRGHDVDLSDIINVAMVQYKEFEEASKDWREAWEAIEEAVNTRSSRTISNIISLCRYAYAIADYMERVANAIRKYNKTIFDKQKYPHDALKRICRYSPHWMGYLMNNGAESARSLIYSYLLEQQNLKQKYARKLRKFADDVLALINSKLNYAGIKIEIQC